MSSENISPNERLATINSEFGRSFKWTVLARNLITTLAHDPQITLDELMVVASGEPKDFPEINALGHLLDENRKAVHVAHTELSKIAPTRGKTLSETVFDYAKMPNSPRRPTGRVRVDSKANPFVIGLHATGRDARFLVPPMVGGHFVHNRELVTLSGDTIRFPMIVAAYEDDSIFMHESAHAWNWLIWRSFEGVEEPHLWGGPRLLTLSGAQVMVGRLEERWKRDKYLEVEGKGLEETDSWKGLMAFALAHSKAEFLTDFVSAKQIRGEQIKAMRNPDGHYNYSLLLPWNDKGLADYFWTRYLQIFDHEVSLARSVDESFHKMLLGKRKGAFPWQLMRIPMGEWQQGLDKIGVTDEINLINKIYNLRNTVSQQQKGMVRGALEWVDWELKLGQVLRRHQKDLQNNQNQSLIPQLNRIQVDLAGQL